MTIATVAPKMGTARYPEGLSTLATRDTRSEPVLLATDGMGVSNAPALVARIVARRLQRPLHVVAAVEPIVVFDGTPGAPPMIMPIDIEAASINLENVRRNIRDALHGDTDFTAEVRYGSVSTELASAARESKAAMLVVGAAPHRKRHHIVSGVRAVQLLHKVSCPVLSVVPRMQEAPRRLVAATDFSLSSIRAAREALALAASNATLTLVHVTEPREPLQVSRSHDHAADVGVLLNRVRDHLARLNGPGVIINTMIRVGHADDAIMDAASEMEADLIAVGTHGPSAIERLLIGSVAANVLHRAPCSVLAAPPPRDVERIDVELDTRGSSEIVDRASWAAALDAVSARNTGRRVRMEVDDPTIGAQLQANGYVFQGVVYDQGDHRVDIMLGVEGKPLAHLTRTITGVDSLALTGADGRDNALQLRSGPTVTLLVLEK